MYFDPRLWQFTKGVRLRIAGSTAVGLLAAIFGIGRLALLGWLLAKVFRSEPLQELIVPFGVVAGVMLVRGFLEYARNMAAHRTAALVQVNLRKILYEKVMELGPAHFGRQRTGEVILSIIDGVEQLETYFGQYLPQLFEAALTPVLIAGFAAYFDIYIARLRFAFVLLLIIYLFSFI